MSARIRTVNTFSFKYGRVEVRAKMPIGDWLWPGELFFLYLFQVMICLNSKWFLSNIL